MTSQLLLHAGVILQLIIIHTVRTHPARPVLPLCTEEELPGREATLQCIVFPDQFLDYEEIRTFTKSQLDSKKYNVSINCYNHGSVRLPWPFFAKNVISLKVTGCTTVGLLSERTTPQVNPNELQRVVISDVKHKVTLREFYDSVMNLQSVDRDYECGQSFAAIQIFRNIDYIFPDPTGNQEELLMMEELFSALNLEKFMSLNKQCDYPNLKYLEESGSRSLSAFHLKIMESSHYPKLEAYSMRNNSMNSVPNELQRLNTRFTPNLSSLDLADNEITSANFVLGGERRKELYINLQRNFISSFTKELLREVINSKRTVIDIRENPLDCSCELYAYANYLLTIPNSAIARDVYRETTCKMVRNGIVEQHFIYESGIGNTPCNV